MTTLPTVSVVCPTANRRRFIPQLLKCFERQDYKGKMELVILDSGDDGTLDIIPRRDPFGVSGNQRIVYERTAPAPIGSLRNQLNKLAQGEIIVCMDSDDYYPPERVSHAVEELMNSDKLIAGLSSQIVYFPDMKCLLQTPVKHPYHATNATLAYKREYLKYHQYDPKAEAGEEKSFLNGFTEPLIQLDYRKTILVIAHGQNTISKKNLIHVNTPLYMRPIETVVMDPEACAFYNELGESMRKGDAKDGHTGILI